MTNSDVQIIELPMERWREYTALRLTALLADPQAFSGNYAESLEYPDELWQSRLASRTNILRFAERDGRLIGSIGALIGSNDRTDVAQIIAVFVEREERRQGVGRLLLDDLLRAIRQRPEIMLIRLGVTETQSAAIALYRSSGFEIVGRKEGSIQSQGHAYDELLMERANE